MNTLPVHVLVIFSCSSGETERLALAAAVGAVQARANIRLRRLPDSGDSTLGFEEELARMRREYVPPKPADAAWADAVLIAMNGSLAGAARTPAEAMTYGRRAAQGVRGRGI